MSLTRCLVAAFTAASMWTSTTLSLLPLPWDGIWRMLGPFNRALTPGTALRSSRNRLCEIAPSRSPAQARTPFAAPRRGRRLGCRPRPQCEAPGPGMEPVEGMLLHSVRVRKPTVRGIKNSVNFLAIALGFERGRLRLTAVQCAQVLDFVDCCVREM